jgi:hypothetical protein
MRAECNSNGQSGNSVLKAFLYAASDFVGCRDIAAFRITFELPKNVLA